MSSTRPLNVPRFDTLPDVARKLRGVTSDVGAENFALLFFAAGTGARRLVPCMDSEYPGVSGWARKLTAALGDSYAKRAMVSTQPFWWTDEMECTAADALGRCLWAERVEPITQGETALAYPLSAEHGREGLIVFSGRDIAVSSVTLASAHARCLMLFSTVSALWSEAPAGTPQISRRELECLKLTANGHTSEEIASRLGLSVHTANQYLGSSASKLNANGRMHAVAKALRGGLID